MDVVMLIIAICVGVALLTFRERFWRSVQDPKATRFPASDREMALMKPLTIAIGLAFIVLPLLALLGVVPRA